MLARGLRGRRLHARRGQARPMGVCRMTDDSSNTRRTSEPLANSGANAPQPKYTLGRLLAEVESCSRAAESQRRLAENYQTQFGGAFAVRDFAQAAANEFRPDSESMPGINRLIAICNDRWGEGITPNTVRRLRGAVCRALALTVIEADGLTLDEVADALKESLSTTSQLGDCTFNPLQAI